MSQVVHIHRGRYHDSVTLLWASAAARDVPGVEAAIVAMATDMNRDLLATAGFPMPEASADDLVVAVRCVDGEPDAAGQALAAVEEALSASSRAARTGETRSVAPRTVEGAAARSPEAGVVLVSVPGRYAYVEAVAALRAGRHVMVFSDGVDVATEVRLKREAARLGRLVMGPDCGTVVLDGVGLGFANVVASGPVALVAASGTGAQQLCCLLDGAGIGVRHVVGVGGRDLTSEVGGLSTRAALVALDADPAVDVIGVVAKSAAPAVRAAVAETAAGCRTPVVYAFVGAGERTITEAAAAIAVQLGRPFPEPESWSNPLGQQPDRRRGSLLGLFSGGTNAAEALVVVEERLGPVRSNVHHDPAWSIGPHDEAGRAHVVLDLGDDRLTVGRPHPMIDPAAVADRLRSAAGSVDGPGVVLIDVVLGHGAHPDPASVLAPAVADAVGAGIPVVATLVGAVGDPQGLDRQAGALVGAGAAVFRSNASAAAHAAQLAVDPHDSVHGMSPADEIRRAQNEQVTGGGDRDRDR